MINDVVSDSEGTPRLPYPMEGGRCDSAVAPASCFRCMLGQGVEAFPVRVWEVP